MGEKKTVTIINLTLILDSALTESEFEQLCVPNIRHACLGQGEKFAPEVMIESFETKEMEIIQK